jgi:hypothetical protein
VIYAYRQRPIDEWETVTPRGALGHVRVGQELHLSQLALSCDWPSGEGSIYVLDRWQLTDFPAEVAGLDWQTFAATMRVPVWVAQAMYEQGEGLVPR